MIDQAQFTLRGRNPDVLTCIANLSNDEVYELPELIVEEPEANEAEEEARVRRFLEVKTQSILFKRSVTRELEKAGIPFKQDHCEGIYSTDFLIEKDGQRLALECKFNVHRDMERLITTCEILKEKLFCREIIVIFPYALETDLEYVAPINKIRSIVVSDLATLFS